jgi:hypothetical protein
MSDSSVTPATDTGEALTRMAGSDRKEGGNKEGGNKDGGKRERGKKERTAWGPLVLIFVLFIPLAAVAWVAWRQGGLQREVAALREDNATLQQLSAASAGQFANAQRQLEEVQQRLQDAQQQQQELGATVQQKLQEELAASRATGAEQAGRLAALEAELTSMRLRLS